MTFRRSFGILLAAQLAAAAPLAAQDGVASSGMGQGEAVINVRSDVKMAIKGTRGTTSARIEKLGRQISDAMPAVQACYRELVKSRPATVGALRIEIALEPGTKDVAVAVTEQDGSDRQLTSCVKKVLARLPLQRLERPSAAVVTLQFSNSRADGQGRMEDLAARRAEVQVATDADGTLHAEATTGDGKVTFQVLGDQKLGEAGVQAVLLALRTQFAGFLDCRRRSNKQGLSPAGVTEADLSLQHKGKARAKIKSCSVAHKRAPICVERALGRVSYEGAPAGKRARVRVTFVE